MNPTIPTYSKAPTLNHYLLLCAVAALWIDFSHVHRTLNSDTLVFSIASRYAWTPFFWEQDRIGMFVPLLTSWCSDPMATLLLQTAITAFMGLALPLLLIEFLYPQPAGRLATMLANALMLALAPDRVRANFLFECCYPQAMFLGCAGLLVLGSRDRPRWWRYPLAFSFFVLAHWTYLGVSVWLMPLAFWNAVVRPGVAIGGLRDFSLRLFRYFPGWGSLLLLSGALGLGLWFMSLANEAAAGRIAPTRVDSLPEAEWQNSWINFWDQLNEWPGMPLWKQTAVGLALVGLIAMLASRKWPGHSLPAACLVLGIAGTTEYLFLGTRGWPTSNEYHFRYILGAIICTQVILSLVAIAPIAAFRTCGSWIAFGIGAMLILAGATTQYGLPFPTTPRSDLDIQYGAQAAEVRTSRVDAIGGDYWTVWPLFLYMGISDPPGSEIHYPIAFRSSVFRPRWESSHSKGLRVAVRRNIDKEKDEFFRAAQEQELSEPVKIATHGSLDIYFTRPNSALGDPAIR